MARFLIAVWPIPGHYYPNLSLAVALRSRGHEVAFFSGRRAQPVIEREGFPCFCFRHTDESVIDKTFFSPRPAAPWWKPQILVQRGYYYAWVAGTLGGQVSDIEEAIDRWHPDVLVCDPSLWGPILVVPERHRIPVAVFAYIPFCPLPGPDVPPLGFGIAPPRTLLAHFSTGLLNAIFRIGSAPFRNAANEIRRQHGLAPISVSPTEYAAGMPLYLVTGAADFDYERHDLPSSVRYIGPCPWQRTKASTETWFEELPRDRPWVYVSEGTLLAKDPFVSRAAAQGLANLRMQVILTTSTPEVPDALKPVPPNVRVEHWTKVHYDDVLPRASVVVTTGGGGTVVAALQAGLPLVIVPTDWDKPDIAQRVVQAGAAIRITPRNCSPARLREAVEKLLNDDSFRANARRLGNSLSATRGPAQAAELLEGIVPTEVMAERQIT
jgi:MGT family glycosyltransferase